MCVLFIAITILLTKLSAGEKVRYENYSVHTVLPISSKHVEILEELQNLNDYHFWTRIKDVGSPVDVMVPPHKSVAFENIVASNAFPTTVMINNVQEKIDKLKRTRRNTFSKMHWYDYHSGEEINAFLKDLSQKYPKQVKVLTVGRTYENRDIVGVHVSFSKANSQGKRSIFIEGGIHAREWISPATVTFLLHEILTTSKDTIRRLARAFDWYFFPIFNPDGYAYTFTKDRLWRNTRQPHGCPFQVGADPNRNWGVHWLEAGSSNDPCSVVYAGSSAFSENCTRALANFIATISDQLLGYIAFHSYGQALVIPYGYTSQHLDNYDELKYIGINALNTLAWRYGTHYEIGNAADVIYPVSGSSMDWVKNTFKTRLVYTFELRDKGRHGFLLPPEEIIPTAKETMDALLVILREALEFRN